MSETDSTNKLVRLDLNYIGRDFCGWQSQPNGGSVQDVIEAVLAKIFSQNIRITGASRTDTGVHARHQVASFQTSSPVDTDRLCASLTALLPESIGVQSVAIVDADFHPIYAARAKLYRYRIRNARVRDAFMEPWVLSIADKLDTVSMLAAMRGLVGSHDFTSFCAADSAAKTRVREIIDVRLERPSEDLVDLWFLGRGFLKQMVRSIVGTLIQVGRNRRFPEDIPKILAARDRSLAGATAAAKGLCLERIYFEEPHKDWFERLRDQSLR